MPMQYTEPFTKKHVQVFGDAAAEAIVESNYKADLKKQQKISAITMGSMVVGILVGSFVGFKATKRMSSSMERFMVAGGAGAAGAMVGILGAYHATKNA